MSEGPPASGDQVRVAVRVPGTTANLGPGFDALGMAVSRYLSVGVVDRDQQRVTTRGEGAGEVPTDDTNLIWTSLVRFCDEQDAEVPDVSLVADNDLPLERGLGSSSAAIVAGLALGRALTGVAAGDLDIVRLADAIEGHPDNVAPAVLGGFVACTVDAAGDLVVRRAQPDPRLALLVAVPPTRQNTNAARAAMPDALDRADVATQASRAVHVAGGLTGAWPVATGAAGDLLHEPARLGVMPDSRNLVAALRAAGLHAWLSGAGPSVAAAVPRSATATRDAAVQLATDAGFDAQVLTIDLGGVVACTAERCAVAGPQGCAHCPPRGLC